jgi:tRNA nucleotidyltransferase/poly(A) polymerase
MNIPEYVIKTTSALKKGRFEAYIVGGCVRDFLMGKEPKDWDITTNAKPEEILAIFENAKYENNFGTVLLPIREGEVLKDVLEITTYRSEQGYSDRRHPDVVLFEEKLDKDLERRDFTINALALNPENPEEVIDLFGGRKDIKLKIIRAVGEPSDRFKEDALRMLRAVRFSSQLGFELEPKTQRGIVKLAGSLKFVSKERIKDELIKILASDRPADGIMLLHDCKLLQYIIPELEQGVDVKQVRHHNYNVLKHND